MRVYLLQAIKILDETEVSCGIFDVAVECENKWRCLEKAREARNHIFPTYEPTQKPPGK